MHKINLVHCLERHCYRSILLDWTLCNDKAATQPSRHREWTPVIPAPSQVAPVERRVAAIEAVFEQQGMEPKPFIETMTHAAEEEWVPRNGARVVAKAWTYPAFRQRLFANGKGAVAELGLTMPAHHRHLVALENRRRSTTSSFARCVPVRRSRSSGCPRTGTRISTTARAPCVNPVQCCARWAWTCRPRSKFGCGIPLQIPVTW